MTSTLTAAVVVTFNRKQLLAECLDALLRQTRKLDAIFLVDNASSDGTRDFLQERGYLDIPSVRYLLLPHNVGGAGGFHAGMEAALKECYDWVWVMDDDTEPYSDSLEKMEILKQYPHVVAIANRKVDSRGNDTADGLRLLPKSAAADRPYERARFSSFVGLLIRSSAMAKIGLPKAEFFIHNDDTEYCLRLRSLGEIAVAEDSLVAHKETARNLRSRKVLSHTFYQKDIHGFCFDYFGHRNYAWIQEHYCENSFVRYVILLTRFAAFSIAVLAFDRDHRWLRIKILAKANLDGLRGNFDNGFPQRLRERLKMSHH
jgi:rhamnopyranosyl-N-acetylglucosaminyl-diphospho-decaprenol beta-1,3/1,4-galactofuranosyltransferase